MLILISVSRRLNARLLCWPLFIRFCVLKLKPLSQSALDTGTAMAADVGFNI